MRKRSENTWVIGCHEIANNIFFLGKILKLSTTVNLTPHRFYPENKYDYTLYYHHFIFRIQLIKVFMKIFTRPILLAYLASKSTHFWYIWDSGFLEKRDYEFKFLKSKSKKIICMFVGDDIRSIELTNDFSSSYKLDMHTQYTNNMSKNALKKYEAYKKNTAYLADKYADVIFSHKMCQISYLKSDVYSWRYMYPKEKFIQKNVFFDSAKRNPKVLHAPSSKLFKGTHLVRAAIKKLQLEGYDFDYVELIGVTNNIVEENLIDADIVLNQFYAFTPGLFGIEAMAKKCAVLMSADPSIERGLPQDSKDAWMITKYWQVYDNLKYLLDNPEKIKYYADNGYKFAYKHYTFEAAGEYIHKILKEYKVIHGDS